MTVGNHDTWCYFQVSEFLRDDSSLSCATDALARALEVYIKQRHSEEGLTDDVGEFGASNPLTVCLLKCRCSMHICNLPL